MIEIGIGPNIVNADNFVLSWHGFLSFVAVIVAVLLTARLAPKHGISTDDVYSVATWGILGGIIGARLLHVVDEGDFYWNNPEKTAATIVDGWLNTGDTYRKDKDGCYVYGGRSDDMMKVGGIWCSPIEIEAKLVEHQNVIEAAVVARKDESGLVKPEAHVVLKEKTKNIEKTSEELLKHCKTGLAPYKYPRWFQFPLDLPKTATGKIQRFKLRSN